MPSSVADIVKKGQYKKGFAPVTKGDEKQSVKHNDDSVDMNLRHSTQHVDTALQRAVQAHQVDKAEGKRLMKEICECTLEDYEKAEDLAKKYGVKMGGEY